MQLQRRVVQKRKMQISIASVNEQDGTILYDEALILDVDYESIDKIAELKEYIQKGSV